MGDNTAITQITHIRRSWDVAKFGKRQARKAHKKEETMKKTISYWVNKASRIGAILCVPASVKE